MFKKLLLICCLGVSGCSGGFANFVEETKPSISFELDQEQLVSCSSVSILRFDLEVCYVQTIDKKELCLRSSFLKWCRELN